MGTKPGSTTMGISSSLCVFSSLCSSKRRVIWCVTYLSNFLCETAESLLIWKWCSFFPWHVWFSIQRAHLRSGMEKELFIFHYQLCFCMRYWWNCPLVNVVCCKVTTPITPLSFCAQQSSLIGTCMSHVQPGHGLTHVPMFRYLRTEDTLRPILKRAVWSLKLAYQCQRPTASIAANDGFTLTKRALEMGNRQPKLCKRFAVTEIKGDWKWIVELFETWDHYWKAGRICYKCNSSRITSRGPLYVNFGHPWVLRTTQQFISECLPQEPNPLVTLPGFHVEMLYLDVQL